MQVMLHHTTISLYQRDQPVNYVHDVIFGHSYFLIQPSFSNLDSVWIATPIIGDCPSKL